MEGVNYIPGDEVNMLFLVNGMRGEIYNIENFSSLKIVYMLKTVFAEMTTYFAGQSVRYCSGLMRDNFAFEYYGLDDGRNIILCPRLRDGHMIRRSFRRLQVIIRDVSDSETE